MARLTPHAGAVSLPQFPPNALLHRPALLTYVMGEKIKSNAQLDGAFEYLKKVGTTAMSAAELEASAGVGVVVSPAEIAAAVDDVLTANHAKLMQERYHLNINVLLGQVTKQLKWADGAAVRAELEKKVRQLGGCFCLRHPGLPASRGLVRC